MNQELINKIEIEIKDSIEKLEVEIDQLQEDAKPISPENSIGRISRMDAINNKSVVEASLRNRRKKLSKLRIALSKVHQPGFGTCISCKGNINPKRLMLLPESEKCVNCA